jgi:hypothetical protein
MPSERSPANLKPEIDLLLCCARKNLDPRHSMRLTQLLQGEMNWQLLIGLADQNGLLPLLCHHLTQFSNAIPPDWLTVLRETNRQNSIRALFLISELQRIKESLERRGVTALPYKGPISACLAYGDGTLRQFDDLDIVVPQASIAQVYDEMDALGYQPRFSREHFLSANGKNIPGEYVFVHKINRAIVEFHTERTLRHFPRVPDLTGMIRRANTIHLNGRQLPTFSIPDTLLMLCVHGAKDFWSRMIWSADIAAVSTMLTKTDWELLLARAEECDAQIMVSLGLWLAQSIFEFEIPATKKLDCDHVTLKVGKALRNHLLERSPLPESLRWRSLYRIRMVKPLPKGIAYWLRLSTAPSEDDWPMSGDLPNHRAPYALLRPLRLWRTYRDRARHRDQSGG